MPGSSRWQCECSSALIELGFKQGIACPCIFVHEDRDVVVTVHGDDFTAVGPKSSLDWYEAELSEEFGLKIKGRLGEGPEFDKQVRVLNRMMRLEAEGLRMKPIQGIAKRLCKLAE